MTESKVSSSKNLEAFVKGRKYQIIADRYNSGIPNRSTWIEKNIAELTKDEKTIDKNIDTIINASKREKVADHVNNCPVDKKIIEKLDLKECFELGKSVQFILDTNNKISEEEITRCDANGILNMESDMKYDLERRKMKSVYMSEDEQTGCDCGRIEECFFCGFSFCSKLYGKSCYKCGLHACHNCQSKVHKSSRCKRIA